MKIKSTHLTVTNTPNQQRQATLKYPHHTNINSLIQGHTIAHCSQSSIKQKNHGHDPKTTTETLYSHNQGNLTRRIVAPASPQTHRSNKLISPSHCTTKRAVKQN